MDLEKQLKDEDIPFVDIDKLAEEGESELEASSLAAIPLKDFQAKFIATAKSYLGINRDNNLPQIAKFLALFNLPTKQDGAWVPFCAAGASYAAVKTYCDMTNVPYTADNSVQVFKKYLPVIKNLYFYPSPSCLQIKQDAVSRGTWTTSKTGVVSGCLVEYNWEGGDVPHHVGIVESLSSDHLNTVEFNTAVPAGGNQSNGGEVAQKIRNYNCVVGYVKLK